MSIRQISKKFLASILITTGLTLQNINAVLDKEFLNKIECINNDKINIEKDKQDIDNIVSYLNKNVFNGKLICEFKSENIDKIDDPYEKKEKLRLQLIILNTLKSFFDDKENENIKKMFNFVFKNLPYKFSLNSVVTNEYSNNSSVSATSTEFKNNILSIGFKDKLFFYHFSSSDYPHPVLVPHDTVTTGILTPADNILLSIKDKLNYSDVDFLNNIEVSRVTIRALSYAIDYLVSILEYWNFYKKAPDCSDKIQESSIFKFFEHNGNYKLPTNIDKKLICQLYAFLHSFNYEVFRKNVRRELTESERKEYKRAKALYSKDFPGFENLYVDAHIGHLFKPCKNLGYTSNAVHHKSYVELLGDAFAGNSFSKKWRFEGQIATKKAYEQHIGYLLSKIQVK